MKKLITYGCLILGIIFFSNSNALAQSDLNIGGGLAYGTEIEAIGVQAGAVLGFNENLRGAGDIAIYFPDSPSGVDNSFWAINANVHYLFMAEEATTVYGLGGLNYATSKTSGSGMSFSNSEAGLNLGGGAEFGVGFGAIYLEAKYVVSDFDQLVLGGGVRFAL
jgi:outer membrane protein X